MKNIFLVFGIFTFFSICTVESQKIEKFSPQWNFIFSGSHKEELIYGKNITSFNKHDLSDEIFYSRGTTDIAGKLVYDGLKKYDDSSFGLTQKAIVFGGTVRARIPRGTTENLIKTTPMTVKLDEVVFGEHQHSLSRHFFWIRSAYTEIDISAILGLSSLNKHALTIGMFPYKLDPQGVVLGDAYAVSPNGNFMGETDSFDVDQFACGLLLSDEIIKDTLTTEVYFGLLQNKSGSLSDTNARVFGHLYGRRADSARKFGSFNYIVSGKIIWEPLKKSIAGSLKFIPFGLFDNEREQKIEFTGDAKSKLGTFGIALEYEIGGFEACVQAAVNCGNQQVFGIDRNQIIVKNNGEALLGQYNTHVVLSDPSNNSIPVILLPYIVGSADQKIVNESLESSLNNGKQIGLTADESPLYNSSRRYRDPYKNTYKGWMALADIGYWVCDKKLRLGFMAAITTGDVNPNSVVQDGDYKGFIPLQELWSGSSKGGPQSMFFLGGGGRPRRPLSVATDAQAPDRFLKNAPNVGGFTNLRLIGANLLWTSRCPYKRPFKVNPNVMVFWQDYATGGASSYLGTEANIFLSTMLYQSFELFGVFALFAPGKHYTDRKGIPALTPSQQEFVDQEDSTGFTAEVVPGISDNLAYSINCGFKITF